MTPPDSPSQQSYDDAAWRNRFASHSYPGKEETYEAYEPALRFGNSLRDRVRDFDGEEEIIREEWEQAQLRAERKLEWSRAREPMKIAWFQDREFASADAVVPEKAG